MGKNEYPKLGQIVSKHKQGICKICGENKSDQHVYVQINWFRGDDEVFNVHKKCGVKIGVKNLLQELIK